MQNRLRELRLDKGLTQASIAKGFGVTQQAISLYEKGEHELKLETLKKMADFFDVSVPYLRGYVNEYIDIHDLNEYEQEAYNQITDMLCEEYPEDSISWSKIGQLLINADTEEF